MGCHHPSADHPRVPAMVGALTQRNRLADPLAVSRWASSRTICKKTGHPGIWYKPLSAPNSPLYFAYGARLADPSPEGAAKKRLNFSSRFTHTFPRRPSVASNFVESLAYI